MKSKFADLLNHLSDMQESPVYAVRKHILAEAERTIVQLERDAARYKWLRENISADMEWYLFGKHGQDATGMDDAIDAAILKSPNVWIKGRAPKGVTMENKTDGGASLLNDGFAVILEQMEREAFEKWCRENPDAVNDAYTGWKARAAHSKPCRGVAHHGCNYLAGCGTICNKCGQSV